VGGSVTGTVAVGQAVSGTVVTNNYAEIKNGTLSLQGTTVGTPAAGMYVAGPNIAGSSFSIASANTSSFFGGIAAGTAVTFTASIDPVSSTDAGLGGKMTVTSVPTGTGIVIGYVLSGTGVTGGSYVSANLSGTATSNPSTWLVNLSQTVASTTITATPITLTVSGVGVGTVVPGAVISWTGGFVAQSLAINNVNGNGLSATVTFSSVQATAPFATGQAITITGNANSNFNGTFKVTACSTSICTFDSGTSATGAGGTVTSAGSFITANGNGTGGTGTYYVSPAPTASVTGGTLFAGVSYSLTQPTLTSVNIISTGGQFNCDATNLAVGMTVTISGTLGGTGTITSYANPTTYYIIATNGRTTFTLSTTSDVNTNVTTGVVTTVGTPTGLTYTLGYVSYQNSGIKLDNLTGYITATGTGSGGAGTYTVSTSISATGNIAIAGSSYSLSASQTAATPGPVRAVNNLVTVDSSAGMSVGEPFVTNGSGAFGVLTNSTTYYITEVPSATTVAISTSFGGSNVAVTTATGTLAITAGSTLGGLTSGTAYYVATINQTNNQIQVSASSTLSPITTISSNSGGAWTSVTGAGAAASSPDGINWTPQTLSNLAWNALTFGNTNTSFTGSISGTTLTVTSGPTGSGIIVGAVLNGVGVIAGTTITGNLTGTQFGSSSTWTVSTDHTAVPTGSTTITSAAPTWVAIASGTTSALSIPNFTRTQARAVVTSGQVSSFRITEPGSGYTTPPTVTLGDPNATVAATYTVRTGIGALANPTFTSRGTGYSSSTTTISGTGYADIYQNSQYMNVTGMTDIPTLGSNIQFAGNSAYYKLVLVSSQTGTPGNYSATLQISPLMSIALAPVHGVAITMRVLYSQVRLTGHDFLSIGTGTIATTNYPNTPSQAADQANETAELGGGRVFYTSTDQDGNFNVGDLFTVQQSTGVATLNANAFNLSGLQTLQLGSVTLGSSNTSISQFSTDATFSANSDNIVPTQKAIRTYIASQIGGGNSTVNVNTLVAGTIQMTSSNISNTAGTQINIKNKANFTQGIDGSPLALNYFLLR
jgi:hypothetical protein